MFAVVEFGFQTTRATAGSGPIRTTTLNHEPGNNAVKNDAVVKLIARKVEEVLCVIWRNVLPQLDRKGPVVGFDRDAWMWV